MSDKTRFHQRLSVQLSVTVARVTSLAFGLTLLSLGCGSRQSRPAELDTITGRDAKAGSLR